MSSTPTFSILPPLFPEVSDLIMDPNNPLLEFCMNENQDSQFEIELFNTLEQVAPNVQNNNDNQNVQLPFVDFNAYDDEIGENDLLPIEDIQDFDIQPLINQLTRISFYCHLESRSGRNLPWEITNIAPNYIHKCRRICVQPLQIPNNQFTIIFKLTRVDGCEQGEICFLQIDEHVLKFDTGLNSSKEVKIHRGGADNKPVYCYLHTATCRTQKSGQVKYNVSVYCSMNNQRTRIHSFDTIPLRNHKWESGKNGKQQNSANLISVGADIAFC